MSAFIIPAAGNTEFHLHIVQFSCPWCSPWVSGVAHGRGLQVCGGGVPQALLTCSRSYTDWTGPEAILFLNPVYTPTEDQAEEIFCKANFV